MSEESLLEFPCDIPIKVLGRNVDGFRATVVDIVSLHFEEPADDDIRERLSRDNGYTSLTITIRAKTREQVDALYRELSDSDDIMMVL
jgi:putative lipoic acid-binding regulatory protein